MTQTQSPSEDLQTDAQPLSGLSALKRAPEDERSDVELLLSEFGDDEPDAEATSNWSRPSPRRVIAEALLGAALTQEVRRGLRSGKIAALVVEVPGRDWVAPIGAAAQRLLAPATVFAHDGSARSTHKPDRHGEEVSGALSRGARIVGVSQAPAQYLPSVLTTVADAHLRICAPDASLLRKILREITGKRLRKAKQIPPLSGLSFEEIASAFRPCLGPTQIVSRLAAYVDARSRVNAADDTPSLAELPGYDGPAREWAQALERDLSDYLAGRMPWKRLASSCVLYGPPGTGKTLFAKALARTLRIPVIATSCGHWFRNSEGHLGDVIQAMQRDFDSARALAPAILFIDELEGIPDRAKLTRGRDWWTPVVNHALTLLDGAETPREGLIVIGATNHPSMLDQALIRPGRFDRLIEIALPDAKALAKILRLHLGEALAGVDLISIVRLAHQATPADAAKWAKDALGRARGAARAPTEEDLVAVIAPPDTRSQNELWLSAVHEAGHAIAYLKRRIELDSVSLVSSGESGGRTRTLKPLSFAPTKSEIENFVVAVLAGRAAEHVVISAPSTGAVGDLAVATSLVAKAYAQEGLGDSLIHREEDISSLLSKDRELRDAVDGDLKRLYDVAVELIRDHQASVEAVARTLIERRFLTGGDVAAIVEPTPSMP